MGHDFDDIPELAPPGNGTCKMHTGIVERISGLSRTDKLQWSAIILLVGIILTIGGGLFLSHERGMAEARASDAGIVKIVEVKEDKIMNTLNPMQRQMDRIEGVLGEIHQKGGAS